ncbi:MAG: hypothetical protein ACT4N1_01785 [Nitrososphaerota archaeon]
MKKVIIFGTGGFTNNISLLKTSSFHQYVAFTANEDAINEKKLFDLPITPFETVETIMEYSVGGMFVAIGYSNMNKKRARIFNISR